MISEQKGVYAMIGKICKISTPYYDSVKKRMSFKTRPALVIAQADCGDYVILPVSTITHKGNIDPDFDIPIDPSVYPKLNLNKISYVRTHKQTIAHRASIIQCVVKPPALAVGSVNSVISDLRTEYEELYLEILIKREDFSYDTTTQGLIQLPMYSHKSL